MTTLASIITITMMTMMVTMTGAVTSAQGEARGIACDNRPVTVNLQSGDTPTPGDDVILGTSGDDVIAAGDGDDVICGEGGDDTIFGQAGNDRILAGDGDDKIRGGDGDDELLGEAGSDDLAGGRGDDLVEGGDGADTAVRGGTGNDAVHGGAGDDQTVAGNGGEDIVSGGPGNDKVTGGPRPDIVRGGDGDDEVKGNKGADTLRGDRGDDILKGGPQPDLLDGGFGTDDCASGSVVSSAVQLDTFRDCESMVNLHPLLDTDGDGTVDASDSAPNNPARTSALTPLFPLANGRPQLPASPVAVQLNWLLDQLAAPSTSLADVEAHFAPGGISTAEWQGFIDQIRNDYPSAEVIEVVHAVPNSLVVIIAAPGSTFESAYVQLVTGIADGRIKGFGASPWRVGANAVSPSDAALTMEQTLSSFSSLADDTSVLVAKIVDGGCSTIAGASEDTPRATGSIFKVWVLAALAEAIENGDLTLDDVVPLEAVHIPPAGVTIGAEPIGTSFSLFDMARLMMGVSDNAATDQVIALLDRREIEASLADFGHGHPSAMTPFLSIKEAFQLYWGVPEVEALAYAAGDDAFQQDYLESVLQPLGQVMSFPFANASILVDGSWQASALDLCEAMASLRTYPQGSDAMRLIDEAYGAQAAMPGVRPAWDRVWYKGGSLASGDGLHVLTHGIMLESDEHGTYAVITMANTDDPPIDEAAAYSLTAQLVELVGQMR